MAGKVKDMKAALDGPIKQELLKREGTRAKSKVQYIPHNYKGESEPTAPKGEGTDSEGNEKKLHLSEAPSEVNEEEMA